MDSEGAQNSDSQSELTFNDRDTPITGFAVASSERNADFHELFPDVPEGDHLIEDYGCGLQQEILVQGRLYMSGNHMCFHANIFGWVTDLTIPFADVTGLEKRMVASVIPNAIQVNTTDKKYTFALFLSRDATFDVMQNIWRLAHPSSLVQSPTQENGLQGRRFISPNGLRAHKPTQCECGKNKIHYREQVWEADFPVTPEKIYNLIFASGFIKDFLAKDQKLMSLQISDWYPSSEGSQLLSRTMSYIKPLNVSVGPKQTKGELREETVHFDFDSYVSIITTTRTPDVPNGSIFACKARTCIMWAGPASTKIIVTAAVEWTGRCFIKSIIERSFIEGQRTYHSDLERAMRKYISEHLTEFIPEDASWDTYMDTYASGTVAYADLGALITWISPTPVKVNGGFGDVFSGTHSGAGKVALKRPRIGPTGYNEDLMRRFQREAATWEKLHHPHILKYLGTFERDGHLYFVSPFIENGTLVEYIALHPSVNRTKLVYETADAISYLHAEGVVHGDIKASNLLVGDEGQVLLCDFGLTKTTDLSTTTAMKGVGSLRWQSPELWDGGSKSFKSDVYAFGMTIAEVLTGDVPFPDLQTEGAVIRAVLIQGRRPTKIPAVSSTGLSYQRVWEVAEACLSTIPEERISMNEASRLVQEDLQLAGIQEIDAVVL